LQQLGFLGISGDQPPEISLTFCLPFEIHGIIERN
jgi:hypothetical protein